MFNVIYLINHGESNLQFLVMTPRSAYEEAKEIRDQLCRFLRDSNEDDFYKKHVEARFDAFFEESPQAYSLNEYSNGFVLKCDFKNKSMWFKKVVIEKAPYLGEQTYEATVGYGFDGANVIGESSKALFHYDKDDYNTHASFYYSASGRTYIIRENSNNAYQEAHSGSTRSYQSSGSRSSDTGGCATTIIGILAIIALIMIISQFIGGGFFQGIVSLVVIVAVFFFLVGIITKIDENM